MDAALPPPLEVELERTFGLLFELDAGLIRRWITYVNPAEAYEAAAAST